EVAGGVRERAELVVAVVACAKAQFLDEPDADAMMPRARIDDERAHFRHLRTERRELGTADDGSPLHCHHEPFGAQRDLRQRSRTQVSLGEAGRDERVDLARIGPGGGTKRDSRRTAHAPWPPFAATSPSAASRRFSASSVSASLMTSGGSRRTTVSAV